MKNLICAVGTLVRLPESKNLEVALLKSLPTDRPIRVGFLSPSDPQNKSIFSGIPHSTWSALKEQGLDLVDLGGRTFRSADGTLPAADTGTPANSFYQRLKQATRDVRSAAAERALGFLDFSRTIRHAERVGRRTQAEVDGSDVDILFSVSVNSMLYDLETTIPIVHASDTTAGLINRSYEKYLRRSRGYHRACDVLERNALSRCSIFAPSSQCTAESAVQEYGLEPSRIRVVELGSNVVPDGIELEMDPPTQDHLELVLVAADPKRKRLDLCIDITEILNSNGWTTTLNYVGPHHARAAGHPQVNWCGRLELNSPDDRDRHMAILNQSHWLLLPSLAEAFGIAPGEAAHFGRPSVVSDVGGLPTVVQHDKTGVVVPVDASAQEYASVIREYSTDPVQYAAMSDAALERARTTLSWDAWGERVSTIFEEILNGNIADRSLRS